MEQTDDQHRADVVEDGQRQQEDLVHRGHPPPEQGQHGVCRGRNRPSVQSCRVGDVDRNRDEGRGRHAADGRQQRHRRSARVRQWPHGKFAFEFQTDLHEEQRHQAAIDELDQRFAKRQHANAHMNRHVVYAPINGCEGRIGRRKIRQQRGEDQQPG
nr:hypothetical protein [Denitromonas sp.]